MPPLVALVPMMEIFQTERITIRGFRKVIEAVDTPEVVD
jgi:hypothetical protein